MRSRLIAFWSVLLEAALSLGAWLLGRSGKRLPAACEWIRQRSAPLVAPLRARYDKWPTYWRHFAVCFALGIVIEIGIHWAHGFPAVADFQRWGFDKTVSLLQMYRASGWIHSKPLPDRYRYRYSGFVWVDIDEASWSDERWGGGEPFLQPRREIFQLVDRAFDWGARVVYVDVFLDGKAGEIEQQWLATLQRRSYPDGEPRHLLAARSLRQPLAGGARSSAADVPRDPPRLRPAFWDTYQAPPDGVAVHSVLPHFTPDSDLRVRRWSIGQTVVTGDGARFLPSPQLALYCLHPGRRAPLAAWCQRLAEKHGPASDGHLQHAGAHADDDALASTLLFPFGIGGVFPFDGEADLGYRWFPALSVLTNARIDKFRDAIVVIGSSYEESRDHHQTPVGRLPGALLNLNALDTMLRYGQLRELPWQAKWPLALGLMVFVAALFAFGNRLVATLVAGTLVGAGFIFVVGPLLLRNGLWFDFGAPLLGIYLHRNIEEFRAARARAGKADDGNAAHPPH